MKINKLYIQAFKSFEEETIFDLTQYQKGLILVTGKNITEPSLGANGSGKSSLFEAISWAFFGKTSTNLKAGDIRNWNTKGFLDLMKRAVRKGDVGLKCYVKIDFSIKDHNYLLERTWDPNSLVLNGKTITQETLNNIIGLNFESFSYSILISQFGSKFIDFRPSEKMEIFTQIMDETLKRWGVYSEKSKDKKDLTDSEIAELEKDVSNIEGQLKGSDIINIKQKAKEWEGNNKRYINSLQIKLNSFVPESYFNENIQPKISLVNELNENLDNLEKECLKIKLSIITLRDTKSEYIADLASNLAEKNMLENTLNNLKSIDAECPTCFQSVTNEHKDAEIERITKYITDISNKCDSILTESEALSKQFDVANRQANDYVQEINILSKSIHSTNIEIVRMEAEYKQRIDGYKETSETLEKALGMENPYENMIVEDKSNILKRLLFHKKDSLEKLFNLSSIYKYWSKGFKDIKLMLMVDALKEFEIEINNNINKLGLANWEVSLLLDTENKSGTIRHGFTILVKSSLNNELVPFECWSGGEGQRIRLAVTLGLANFIKNKRGISSDCIIFDEPTQFLSEQGIQDLLVLLKEIAYENNLKLFLIDHRNLETSGEFDYVVKVIKDIEGSYIM